ncbi:MAG: hypothetical protein K0S79_1774 [Nitrospira sp.]|nr:hypothetical protein [Nitrospira sp.]
MSVTAWLDNFVPSRVPERNIEQVSPSPLGKGVPGHRLRSNRWVRWGRKESPRVVRVRPANAVTAHATHPTSQTASPSSSTKKSNRGKMAILFGRLFADRAAEHFYEGRIECGAGLRFDHLKRLFKG